MTELPGNLARHVATFDRHLWDWLTHLPAVQNHLDAAVHYALEAQGKRIRPLLALGAARAVDARVTSAWLAPALAVELIHTYSLIHDDLPAMDDDAWRRGRPTLHMAYDEATAILVGDALQAQAFEVLAAPGNGLTEHQRLACIATLARAAGLTGMVGGQAIDLHGLTDNASESDLEALHRRKTGALIEAAVTMGAWSATETPSSRLLDALSGYACNLGLAFQVIDDILDETGDPATLGKHPGSDARSAKTTYWTLLGEKTARERAVRLTDQALESLQTLPGDTDLLEDLARFTLDRSY